MIVSNEQKRYCIQLTGWLIITNVDLFIDTFKEAVHVSVAERGVAALNYHVIGVVTV